MRSRLIYTAMIVILACSACSRRHQFAFSTSKIADIVCGRITRSAEAAQKKLVDPLYQLPPDGNAASECKSVRLIASKGHPGRYFGRLYYRQAPWPHAPQWITVYVQQPSPGKPKSKVTLLWSITDQPPTELR